MEKRKQVLFGKKYKLNPNILSRRNPDGSVAIMKLDEADYFYVIDGIAAEAWCRLEGPNDAGELATKLARQFKAPEKKITEDLKKLIRDLTKEELLLPTS